MKVLDSAAYGNLTQTIIYCF